MGAEWVTVVLPDTVGLEPRPALPAGHPWVELAVCLLVLYLFVRVLIAASDWWHDGVRR